MSGIEKHLEQAEKHLQKGRSEAALREYLQVLQEDPEHDLAGQAAADLYRALGYRREAASLWGRIFDRQAIHGQAVDAVATYRKLVKVATLTPERSLIVARLLENASPGEALEHYQGAASTFAAAERQRDALGAWEDVVRLAPSVENVLQLGKLAVEVGDKPRAAAAFLQAGELRAQDPLHSSQAVELYQRAHELNKGNVAAAVAYGRALLGPDDAGDAATVIELLRPFSEGLAATLESQAVYGRALLAAGRACEAEPFLWQLFEQDPGQLNYLLRILGHLLDSGQAAEAVNLARRLAKYQQRAGRLREATSILGTLAAQHPPSIDFLEYLVELFNDASRELEYCQTLLQLFQLHYAGGNFLKASECLDRAAEVDPYVPGLNQKLEMLRGKVDDRHVRAIARRLSGAQREEPPVETVHDVATRESTVLEDLMLQAEIFLQYSLRSRATERLERVRKLFPEEEFKNEKLRGLCARAGMPAKPAPATTVTAGAPGPGDEAAVDRIARVTEITRNISRQGSVKSILFTAINEAGRHWNASRCISVLCTPGKAPSLALEYCAPGVPASDAHTVVRLVGLLQPLLVAFGPLVVGDSSMPVLASLKQFAAAMGIGAMLAIPLMEGQEQAGLLLLAHNSPSRAWHATDTIVLKTIADQVVLALSNARLRRLVRNLAGTEEKSGLLKRSSYLDVLLSETARALQQGSSLTVVLLNFGAPSELMRHVGEPALDHMLQQIGQVVSARIRQNSLAVRYDPATVALILSDTNEREAWHTTDRLRTEVASLRFPAHTRVPIITAGIAEAVLQPGLEPADVVTELINRVEAALQLALGQGGNCIHAQAPWNDALASADFR